LEINNPRLQVGRARKIGVRASLEGFQITLQEGIRETHLVVQGNQVLVVVDYRNITLEKINLKIKAHRNHIQINTHLLHTNPTLTTSIHLNLTTTSTITAATTLTNHSPVIPIITQTRTRSHRSHQELRVMLPTRKKEETVITVHLPEKAETMT